MVLHDAAHDEKICPQCGGFLETATKDYALTDSKTKSVSVDNRIHKGDDIGTIHNGNEMHVGGDNAENIDKSTTITTNNTTNNTSNTTNIYQAADAGKELITCGLSGRHVYKKDTFTCRTCHRLISNDFYSSQYNCCSECADKHKAYIERMERLNHEVVQEIQAELQHSHKAEPLSQNWTNNNTSNAISDRRESEKHVHNGNKLSNKVIATVIAILFIGGSFYLLADKNNNKSVTSTSVQQEEQVAGNTDMTVTNSNGVSRNNTISSSASSLNAGTNVPVENAAAGTSRTGEKQLSIMEEGEKYYKSGEYSKSRVFLQQAAESGNPTANYYMALMYENGNGVSADSRKAFKYMKQAAECGYAKAYFPLAEMYRNGLGTEANRAQAKKWYERTVTSDRSHADMAAEILETYE